MVELNTNLAWSDWIRVIAADEKTMDLDRLLRHLQLHCTSHMPNVDAHKDRWVSWLAGTYNLLAILAVMVECNPTFELGISRLFQRWRQHPFDHTPPPKGMVELYRGVADLGNLNKYFTPI